VLDAAAGLPTALIARRVGVAPNTVRKWRKRFFALGYAGHLALKWARSCA
jgi:transposase-like protein